MINNYGRPGCEGNLNVSPRDQRFKWSWYQPWNRWYSSYSIDSVRIDNQKTRITIPSDDNRWSSEESNFGKQTVAQCTVPVLAPYLCPTSPRPSSARDKRDDTSKQGLQTPEMRLIIPHEQHGRLATYLSRNQDEKNRKSEVGRETNKWRTLAESLIMIVWMKVSLEAGASCWTPVQQHHTWLYKQFMWWSMATRYLSRDSTSERHLSTRRSKSPSG